MFSWEVGAWRLNFGGVSAKTSVGRGRARDRTGREPSRELLAWSLVHVHQTTTTRTSEHSLNFKQDIHRHLKSQWCCMTIQKSLEPKQPTSPPAPSASSCLGLDFFSRDLPLSTVPRTQSALRSKRGKSRLTQQAKPTMDLIWSIQQS